MLKNNIYYFKYSIDNKDTQIDFSNTTGKLIIAKNRNETKTQLQVMNNKLIELIITYKTVKNKSKKIVDNIVSEIIDIVENTNLINYSAFCSYFQVLKYSYYSYITEYKKSRNINNKIELFKQILDEYIKNRHSIYMYYGYSDQILQVMADISSAKRNSKTSIEKVAYVLENNKIFKINNVKDINKDRYYILPDKDGKEIFNIILRNNNIKFNFQKERQNKYPDILLKIKNSFYIVEHKMTNGDGGSQNAEINEIISFIKQQETNKKIHYISCLEGNFMSKLNIAN